jgi:hypothetical protein
MGPFLEKAMSRVPATITTGMKHFFCGPESFTPDLSPILGEAPELRNYFVAAVSESAAPACRLCSISRLRSRASPCSDVKPNTRSHRASTLWAF